MMPTDNDIYGEWPRGGEIDIMEVMGSDTKKLYGTLHYGEPHEQSQGTYVLGQDEDFAKQYHVYGCLWEPDKISWYVDDIKYFEEKNWFTADETVIETVQELIRNAGDLAEYIQKNILPDYDNFVKTGEQYNSDAVYINGIVENFSKMSFELRQSTEHVMEYIGNITKVVKEAQCTKNIGICRN